MCNLNIMIKNACKNEPTRVKLKVVMSTHLHKREQYRCNNDGMKPEEEKNAGDGFGNDREELVGGRCDREKQLCRL